MNNNDISIKILGDSGPFSSTGRSISYLINVNGFKFLIDAGAPVFQLLSFPEICDIDAVVITHPHDDHKRWLSDLLLFRKYVTPQKPKVKLLTSAAVHKELKDSIKHALEKTLSPDSEKVVRLPYEEFADCIPLGPTPKYSAKKISLTASAEESWIIIDENGNTVNPDKGKVIIHPVTKDADILLFDETDKCWINPEIYYSFSDENYYKDNRYFECAEAGLKIHIVNAPIWHGITAVGVIVETNDTKIFFSGDTVYNIRLWKKFTDSLFKDASLNIEKIKNGKAVVADINNYIERIWSFKRYKEALGVYINTDFIIHDSAAVSSIVHTDFEDVSSFDRNKTLLAHSPDNYVSYIPLTGKDKNYIIRNRKLFEFIDGIYYKVNADVYIKHQTRYFTGFKNKSGAFAVVENDKGILELKKREELQSAAGYEFYDLYEDINGGYYTAADNLSQIYSVIKNKVYKQEQKENGELLFIPQINHRSV